MKTYTLNVGGNNEDNGAAVVGNQRNASPNSGLGPS
jgi:hypothetical protein